MEKLIERAEQRNKTSERVATSNTAAVPDDTHIWSAVQQRSVAGQHSMTAAS